MTGLKADNDRDLAVRALQRSSVAFDGSGPAPPRLRVVARPPSWRERPRRGAFRPSAMGQITLWRVHNCVPAGTWGRQAGGKQTAGGPRLQ